MAPVVLQRGVLNPDGTPKDGNPHHPYVAAHPTHYNLAPRVAGVAMRLVNMPQFLYRIWCNSYRDHPPANPQPSLSFDIWDWGGRGAWLPKRVGQRARDFVFNDPNPPDIWWHIYEGWMFVRDANTFEVRMVSMAQDDLDNAHYGHAHTSYFQADAQTRFTQQANRLFVPESMMQVREEVKLEDLKVTREELADFLAEAA